MYFIYEKKVFVNILLLVIYLLKCWLEGRDMWDIDVDRGRSKLRYDYFKIKKKEIL